MKLILISFMMTCIANAYHPPGLLPVNVRTQPSSVIEL